MEQCVYGLFRMGQYYGIKRMTTKPIRNEDFRAKSKGLSIFMRSQNLWDFALDKKK